MSIFNGTPDKIIGNRHDPMLLRWNLIRVWKLPRVYLHKFLRSDDDRAPHDHPWWFISILLRGTYIEHINGEINVRTAPAICFRSTKDRHRVELLYHAVPVDDYTPYADIKWQALPTWSIIITGPVVRRWGFWCDDRFFPSREFEGC